MFLKFTFISIVSNLVIAVNLENTFTMRGQLKDDDLVSIRDVR